MSCKSDKWRAKLGLPLSSGLTEDQTRIMYAMEHMTTEQRQGVIDQVKAMNLATKKEENEQIAALIRKSELYAKWDGEKLNGPRIEPIRR